MTVGSWIVTKVLNIVTWMGSLVTDLRGLLSTYWSFSTRTKFLLAKEFVFGPCMNLFDVGTDVYSGYGHFRYTTKYCVTIELDPSCLLSILTNRYSLIMAKFQIGICSFFSFLCLAYVYASNAGAFQYWNFP